LYSDAAVYVVKDIRPAAETHWLVITHAHVHHCDSPAHELPAFTVQHMRSVAEHMLQRAGLDVSHSRLGFHVPPCISQPHLHMHVLAGTFRGPCSRQCPSCCSAEHCCVGCDCLRVKYTTWCCWYRSVDAQLARMEANAARHATHHCNPSPLPPAMQHMRDG
jgi:hypothetical protein